MEQHKQEALFPERDPADLSRQDGDAASGEGPPGGNQEESLLRNSFPHTYAFCLSQGYYRIPDMEMLIRSLEGGIMLQTSRNAAVLRLDMSISCLWPFVAHLFNFNVFPSRLAAGLHLLRAAEFGEGAESSHIQALGQELSQALDALEALLVQSPEPLPCQAAAEPDV